MQPNAITGFGIGDGVKTRFKIALCDQVPLCDQVSPPAKFSFYGIESYGEQPLGSTLPKG